MFLEYLNRVFVVKLPNFTKSQISEIGHSFVKIVANNKLHIPFPQIEFEKGVKGKPFLKDYADFHFNISHSGDFLAVAFANSSVGVDVEKIRPVNPKIANRFFTKEEEEFIKNENDFFYVWTRKEAFIKETGEGLSKPLTSFNSLENPNLKSFDLCGGFVAVCNKHAENFTLETLETDDFLSIIKTLENSSKI